MRNVTLLCIALLIAVGVLAKNPSASAPSLAASLASFPVAPEPQPAPSPEPVNTGSETEESDEKGSFTAEAADSVSHRSEIMTAAADPQSEPIGSSAPAAIAQQIVDDTTALSEDVIFIPEVDLPLGPLANHAHEDVPLAKISDDPRSYSLLRRIDDNGTQPVFAHSIANIKSFDRADSVKRLFSNSTISDIYSKRSLAQYFEPLRNGTMISDSIVPKADFVQAPSKAQTLPEQAKQLPVANGIVATNFNSRPLGVLDFLTRTVPSREENAGLKAASLVRQTAEVPIASETSISSEGGLHYRRPSSLIEVIANSISDVTEQPILPPRMLAKPKAVEVSAQLETRSSLSSSITARKMFKDTLSPMLTKTVPLDKVTEREPLILDVATSVTMMPPMFSEAEAKRAMAVVMPVAPSKFSINIAPDTGSALKNSKVDVKPVSVKDAAVKKASASPSRFKLNIQDGGYCDTNFVGPTITFAQTAELTLDDLLYQIHNRFGVNFLMGPDLGKLPINIKSGSIPWNTLLRSQLFVSGVRATCLSQNTIQLIKNESLPKLQSGEAVKTTFLKLKYLQPTTGGNVDVAGQRSSRGGGGQGDCGGGGGGGGGGLSSGGGQQGCGNFEKLIIEIEKILGIRSMSQSSIGGGGGGSQGGGQQTEELRTNRSVTVIPGRNILLVRANDEELELIEEIIRRADRAPFQVVIKGLIYTANQDRLKDVGVQTTITEDSGRTTGGIFGHTLGSAGTLFDFSTIIGTFDFNVQATALQQNGVISIKSRPFATVLDGETTDLTVGRQVPVLIQAINPTGGIPGSLQILQAANLLSVTPHVIDDENGNPIGVNLELQLDSNEVDTSVISQGVPSVSVRSIQTRLMLNPDQTAILGGFTLDSDSRSISKTPGLGDIPIIGELFKRRVKQSQINRLYFAISVSIIPFPGEIRPVDVPGATPQPPSITPEMKIRGDKGEPKQVTGP